MRKSNNPIRTERRKITFVIVILIALATVTPALAEYIGPKRTVTETKSVCKIILYECQDTAKGWRYHQVDNWSCSNESRPWTDYPSEEPRECTSAASGENYWGRVDEPREVTTTYPPATINGVLQNCTLSNGWCTSGPLLSLTANEPISGETILYIEGTRNSDDFACSGSSCLVSLTEGVNSFTYWAFSSFADTSEMGTLTAKVDSQRPTIAGTLSGTSGNNGWYKSPITFNGSASDATSGIASLTCTLDGVALDQCDSISVGSEGLHTLTLIARDNAGHSRTLTQNTSIDTQPPALNASLVGTLGSNKWFTGVTLNASASDALPGSGLSMIEFNIDGGNWIPFPESGELTLLDGQHTVNVRAVDNAGHAEISSKSYWLDSVSPAITIDPVGTLGEDNWYTTNLNLSASATDTTAGLDIFEYSLNDGSWTTYTAPLILSNGTHTISFWAQDQAGLVTQENRTYNVDTRPPQIAGSLQGISGENGWFISDVTLAASASDPAPGSGMDEFTYILDGSPETSYADPLLLSDGLHTVQLNAYDQAGLTYSLEQGIRVDTLPPSLKIQTALPAWIKDSVTLTGTAGDGGSGLSRVEISTNGGQTWQTVSGAASWNFLWNTKNHPSGNSLVLVRARDHAGLIQTQTLNARVDNHGPKISLPNVWYQWDAVTLNIWDNDSGLSEARLEIRDPENRWPARIIRLDPGQFPIQFKWDRRFGDDTVAPLGAYDVEVVAFDNLGNASRATASVNILLGILPAGPTATPQSTLSPESTPSPIYTPTTVVSASATPTAVIQTFGSTLEPDTPVTPIPGTIPTPRATPSQTSVIDWLESVFLPDSNSSENTVPIGLQEEGETTSQSADSGSNVLWGSAAAAMVGAMTSYALETKRKQEEEEAKQAALNAEQEQRRRKKRARKMEKLEEQWAQESAWEAARVEEQLAREAETQARLDSQLMRHGPEAEEGAKWYASQIAILQRAEEKKLEKEARLEARMQAKLFRYEAENGAKWYDSQAELNEKYEQHKAQAIQPGLEAYYNAMRQGEQEAPQPEPNWWEKTKSFVNENFLQPIHTNIYQPFIKPVLDRRQELVELRNQFLDKYIYQPLIKPVYETAKEWSALIDESIFQPLGAEINEAVSHGISYLNENLYQPYVRPALEKTKQFVVNESAWINENLYRPYIQPAVEKVKEKIYEPYLEPVVEKRIEQLKNGISWVNENIYQPIYAPIVNDINEYILQPFVKEAQDWWDEYGEWVHGALDVVGLIPGVGEIADGINGVIYLAEGRKLEATLSFVSAVPVLGYLGAPGKLVLKTSQNVVDKVVGTVAKGVFGEAVEKAAKESVETVAETAVKNSGDWIHSALGIASSIPGISTLTNSLDSLVHLGQGRFLNSTFSTISMIPGVGDIISTGKELVESSLSRVINKSTEELSGAVVKETSETFVEKIIKRTNKKLRQDNLAENLKDQESNETTQEASGQPTNSLTTTYGDPGEVVLPNEVNKVLEILDAESVDYALQDGPDALAALSQWDEKDLKEHGRDLARRAHKDAQVLADVNRLIELQPIDPKNLTDEQKALIKSIADNSTQNSDADKVVLGKWTDLNGGFVERAQEAGAVHYNPHSNMWKMLDALGTENQGEVAWLINQQVVQTAIDKGLPIEYTLNGIKEDIIENEHYAIQAVFSGKTDTEISEILRSDKISIRMKELQELKQAGYKLEFDKVANSYNLIPPEKGTLT